MIQPLKPSFTEDKYKFVVQISGAVVLIKFARNIPVSAQNGLNTLRGIV